MIGADAFAAVWTEAQALPVEQILSGLPSFAALTAGGLAATERATLTLSLPSGTVTFLFTDIEDSTRLWA